MICRNFLFFLRNHAALLLRADSNLDKGTVNIRLADKASVFLGGQNRSLIQQVFQIRAGKARGGLCHTMKIHILT